MVSNQYCVRSMAYEYRVQVVQKPNTIVSISMNVQ